MITFATFHVEKKKGEAKALNALKKNLRNRYHILIDLMFRSAKLFHPTCQRVMLSDTVSNFDYLDGSIEIFRNELEPDAPMMFSRLASQIEYLRSHGAVTDLITLDSDILVNGDMAALFTEEFDIALTYRDREDMPINWGVMLISKRNPDKVISFLEKVLEVYRTRYFTSDNFWRDQYALMDVIDRDLFHRRQSDWLTIEGIKIKLLPCDLYNYSPEDEARAIIRPRQEKILHFKGNRKRFVEIYWNAYLAYEEIPGKKQIYSSLRSRLYLLRAMFLEAGSIPKKSLMNMLKRRDQTAS